MQSVCDGLTVVRSAYLWRRIYGELQLALLPKLVGKFLHEQRREAGAGAAAERVEHEETLRYKVLSGCHTNFFIVFQVLDRQLPLFTNNLQ